MRCRRRAPSLQSSSTWWSSCPRRCDPAGRRSPSRGSRTSRRIRRPSSRRPSGGLLPGPARRRFHRSRTTRRGPRAAPSPRPRPAAAVASTPSGCKRAGPCPCPAPPTSRPGSRTTRWPPTAPRTPSACSRPRPSTRTRAASPDPQSSRTRRARRPRT